MEGELPVVPKKTQEEDEGSTHRTACREAAERDGVEQRDDPRDRNGRWLQQMFDAIGECGVILRNDEALA